MSRKQILILGIGNTLFKDEGVGVRVIEKLQEQFEFPENVSVMDGGVLGLSLMCYLVETDHLIVVDAIKNRGKPGSLYRLEGDEVPKRFLAKNSLHQVDFLETFTACQVVDRVPETVILGVEPMDIETLGIDLTPTVESRVDDLMHMILKELDRLGSQYRIKGDEKDVCGHTC
jgi:hydrogenase maturation protease